MNIGIVSASTRLNRLSHRVALGLQKWIESNSPHQATVIDLSAYQLPVFEEVLHRHPNPPEALLQFAAQIRSNDAFLFVSPEYNGSYTSALKNAVDYLKENEFSQKVIGVVSVTTGPLGGIRAAISMQQLVLGIGGYPIPQMLPVGSVATRFDEIGNLTDSGFEKNIQTFLRHFTWLAEAVNDKKEAAVAVS
jgi:NAD(P)H-dependent FMN reductase